MNNKTKEIYNLNMYNDVKKFLANNKNNIEELKNGKKQIIKDIYLYEDMKSQLLTFFNAFISIYEKEHPKNNNIKISNPINKCPIFKTIDEDKIESIENKARKTIKNKKILFDFEGLINLLNDNNMIYNSQIIRKNIIEYLLKFKSLNYFKVSYININDLNKKYSFLSVKKDKIKFYSKVYFINKVIILNTVNHDNISVKVFYLNKNDIKFLIKDNINNNYFKDIFNDKEKFNLSSIDYKAINQLDKKDKIKFYSFLNNNNLDKKNRILLKEIRKSAYTKKEDVEEILKLKIEQLNLLHNEYIKTFDPSIYYDIKEIEEKIKEMEKNNDLFINNIIEEKINYSFKLKTYKDYLY